MRWQQLCWSIWASVYSWCVHFHTQVYSYRIIIWNLRLLSFSDTYWSKTLPSKKNNWNQVRRRWILSNCPDSSTFHNIMPCYFLSLGNGVLFCIQQPGNVDYCSDYEQFITIFVFIVVSSLDQNCKRNKRRRLFRTR